MAFRRWVVLSLCAVLLLAVGACLGFAPWVRAQARTRAARLGASIAISSVRPGWFGVRLVGVDLSLGDVPAVSVHLDELLVGADRSVTARGGRVLIQGSVHDVQQQLAAWRAKRGQVDPGESASVSSAAAELRDIDVDWTGILGPQTSLHASGTSTPDARQLRSLRLDRLEVRGVNYVITGSGVALAWGTGSPAKLRLVRAERVRAEARWGVVAEAASAPASAAGSSAGLTVGDRGGAARGSQGQGADDAASAADGLIQRFAALKTQLSSGLRGAAQRLEDDARVEVGALEVQLQHGADRLTLGPGPFEGFRKGGGIVLSLVPGATSQRSGVTFRAEVPVGAGGVRMDVVGGPIALASLGVREGDLGLTRIDRTSLQVNLHLVAADDGGSVEFDGSIRAKDLNIAHPKLADEPVEGLAVAAKVKGMVRSDGSLVRLEDSEFDVGAVQLELAGTLERKPDLALDLRFGIPLVSCQAFLDALPAALIPAVKGMSSAGTLSLKGHIRFDPSRPSDYLLDYQASNDCRVTSVPSAVDVARFQAAFRRKVYAPDGKRVEVETGPGTPEWTPLGAMSRYLEVAVMTTEDAHFRTHHGFDHEAIRNSIRENLLKRKFVRGASTISMQLAKNLYLDRQKTLSRKLQELILTVYLEQALTKDQILELYLNAIEFGPMIYGVGPAAYHYFHTSPLSLSLGQALYLSSILPNPEHQHFGSDGRVSEGWMRYLYKLMNNAERRHWIEPDELESGLSEWVVYGSAEPIRTGPGPAGQSTAGDEPTEPGWEQDVPEP